MGSLNPPPHLTNFDFIPKSITQFLSTIRTLSDKILTLDHLVTRLESEMRKIDAFKRELPLCMLLVNDVIIALKEESMVFRRSTNGDQPVLEEFMPVKKICDEDAEVGKMVKEKSCGDKKNWLKSTQLWNANDVDDDPNSNQVIRNPKPNSTDQTIKKIVMQEEDLKINDQPFRNVDSAFIRLKQDLPIHELSFITPEIKNSIRGNLLTTKTIPDGKLAPSSPNDQLNLGTGVPAHAQQQTSRKQRRCWSTELHRQFVNALQQLGGSQVATPKQIRELMQVDGLSNDEVKSHLQKYRLHTRRLPSSNALCSNQSGGVLGGGLQMSLQDQYAEYSKHGISQSGSPDGPLLIGSTTGGTSTTGGDSMDDGEDSKSENYCWKGV